VSVGLVLLAAAVGTGMLAQAPGPSPRWIEVMETADSTMQLDSASIRRAGNDMLEVWSRKIYSTPKHYRDADTYDRMMTRVRINCATRRLMILESSTFLGATPIRRGSGSASRRSWSGELPGSDWTSLIQQACRIGAAQPG
jgi:hypothetical protein